MTPGDLNQLADDHSLSSINDERALVRHLRKIAHEDGLFFYFACIGVPKAPEQRFDRVSKCDPSLCILSQKTWEGL